MSPRTFDLGALLPPNGAGEPARFLLPADHLVTHSVILGMTGSGKTGLAMAMVEEALRNGIPVLAIDVKGDLPNLALTLPSRDPTVYLPWIDTQRAAREGGSPQDIAAGIADKRAKDLASWSLGDPDVEKYAQRVAPRVLTPGANAGEMVHVLSSLEKPSRLWDIDPDAAREALAVADWSRLTHERITGPKR